MVPETFVLFYNTENRWIGENICNGSGLIEHKTRFAYDGTRSFCSSTMTLRPRSVRRTPRAIR